MDVTIKALRDMPGLRKGETMTVRELDKDDMVKLYGKQAAGILEIKSIEDDFTVLCEKIDKLVHGLDPERIGRKITRLESDEPRGRGYFRKGAKSMLEVFTDDYDFIERVMAAFDAVYADGEVEDDD